MTMEDTSASPLEMQALTRKERLKALKRKGDGNKDSHEHGSLPKPLFRSYKPDDDKMKENSLMETEIVNVDAEVKEQLDAAKMKNVIDELDITNLAPRKPDWDLKRDVAKKLEKLERRTHKAIAELIRERLMQRQEDLATMVSAGTDVRGDR